MVSLPVLLGAPADGSLVMTARGAVITLGAKTRVGARNVRTRTPGRATTRERCAAPQGIAPGP
eukprot:2430818-Lingulodinium_polyedra.AAC.1